MATTGRLVVALDADPLDLRRSAPTANDLLLLKTLSRPRRPLRWTVRAFDLVLAVVVLVLTLPIIVVAALCVFVVDPGSPFFVHRRIGCHGRPFGLIKLRTMVTDADERLARLLSVDASARREYMAARKLRNDPRLIPGGELLRKLKIDELPQLWNVIRGDMSIVGPRPVVGAELARYGPFGQYMLAVRPGLTGSWQISDTDAHDYESRIGLDVDFAQRHSLKSLIVLAALTPVRILRSVGERDFA